jgi:hypothetical protein
MNGGEWNENCAFTKNIYRFRTIGGPDGGKYHDTGAAGGVRVRYDRASCALVSYPPPCVKKIQYRPSGGVTTHFCRRATVRESCPNLTCKKKITFPLPTGAKS